MLLLFMKITTLSSESITLQRLNFWNTILNKNDMFSLWTFVPRWQGEAYQRVKVYALHKFKSGSVLIMDGTSFELTPNFLIANTAEKNVKVRYSMSGRDVSYFNLKKNMKDILHKSYQNFLKIFLKIISYSVSPTKILNLTLFLEG